MLELKRKTHIKRFHAKDKHGSEDPQVWTDDPDVWIDIEITDSLVIEQGRGINFRRLKFQFDDSIKTRKTDKKKIKNPDDASQYVEIEMLNELVAETGRGVDFKRVTWKMDNSDGNTQRKTDTYKVYHYDIEEAKLREPDAKKPVPLTDPRVDKSQRVEVEVINSLMIETGRGINYQRTTIEFDQTSLPGARELKTK